MNTQQILDEVRRCGAALVIVDGRLKASPPGMLPAELKAAIRERAAEIKERLLADGGMDETSPRVRQERNRWRDKPCQPMPLRRCGALVCRTCGAHSPSAHNGDCPAPPFDLCHSPWFWLSPHGAIKCVACSAPSDLALVEAWVLAHETGEVGHGERIPAEVLSLLHINGPIQ
jgi:hypothetical protein